jgi:DNA-binding CsgD family transcriptional regulator
VGAENPVRRSRTARETAARLGIAERTVRNIIAEPRDEYEARASDRRKRVIALRQAGHTYTEIAAEVGMTVGGVGTLLHHARKTGVKV